MRARLRPALLIRRPSRAPSLRRHGAEPSRAPDPAVLRVRGAGGPIDEASYTCECGCVFLAPVSTTVACPHCDARQPW
jgi:hypothetical protein